MNILNKFVVAASFIGLLPGLVHGQQLSAVETAEDGVRALLSTVAESKTLFATDRDQYYRNVEAVLSDVVDFNAVAQVVMSRFASSATDAQKQRFADILRTTLTRFYGASLVAYEGQELAFLPGNTPANPRDDTVVTMELRGGDSSFRLQYQMFLNSNDEWKLKNLSLAGINLGRQYFTQFSALMSKHNNDIDQVLDNWQ